MFELKEIVKNIESGKVSFDYQCSADISKYFSKKMFYTQYDISIKNIPEEILAIPLLANVLPISWFAGFDVKVSKLDRVFFDQTKKLKKQFAEYYPEINTKNSTLLVDQLVESTNSPSAKTAMLFSGGVDAYTTFLRHYEEVPDLITIKGADVAISDTESWQMVVDYNESTAAIEKNKKYYIESNIRDFITFEVDQLVKGLGWWGKIQHGLALTSLTAPIAYVNGYETVYIASTRSSKMPFSPWGSMPETDNLVKFSITSLVHDGYELSRLDKVNTILELSSKYNIHPPLRVCYHDFKEKLNCNRCEKCCRTIFAIMVNNKNPNLYGFDSSAEIYKTIGSHLTRGFSTEGVKFYWDELLNNANEESFFYFNNSDEEKIELKKLKDLNLVAQSVGVINKSDSGKYLFKQKLINAYPKSFKLYLKLRRKLS